MAQNVIKSYKQVPRGHREFLSPQWQPTTLPAKYLQRFASGSLPRVIDNYFLREFHPLSWRLSTVKCVWLMGRRESGPSNFW